VYYNPLAPQRLLFWVASEEAAAYAAGNLVAAAGARTFIGADLMVIAVGQPRLMAARSFDSRWHWNPDRAASPLLPAALVSHGALAARLAEAVRLAAGANYAIAARIGAESADAFVSGTTRLADLLPFAYNDPICLFDVSGAELQQMDRRLTPANRDGHALRFQPAPGRIDPAASYRVAISSAHVSRFASLTHSAPKTFRVTDLQAREAIERFLLGPE